MKKLIRLSIAVLMAIIAPSSNAHDVVSKPENNDPGREIVFPDTANYRTLVLDPHIHTSFSDGHVWPSIRVAEALRDGLDAMAITEHMEWQPHLADIPHPDRNRAYEIAVEANADNELIVIAGSEITRNPPVGHINALFISDANKLVSSYVPEDPSDAIGYYRAASQWPAQKAVDAANAQHAFLFWNHPWWDQSMPELTAVVTQFHIDNAEKNLIHGIEIVNTNDYSEEAFQIALDLDLTLMGVSDIHELIDWEYRPLAGGHRPVTLVLAGEKSEQSMREALFAGRTVVWFKNTLIARAPHMNELLAASLTVTSAGYFADRDVLVVEIKNTSDANFLLKNTSGYTFLNNTDIVEIGEHDTTRISVKTGTRLPRIELQFEVLNALVQPKQYAEFTLSIKEIAIHP